MTAARRRRTALLALAPVLLGVVVSGARAAHADDVPSVSVAPAQVAPDDPNGGQWFVLALGPGETGTAVARITNPAAVPQRVLLYTRDLVFTDDGTASVREGEQQDIGSWSDTRPTSLLLGARESVLSEVKITAPRDADPGDHVGVIVAETSNRQEGFDVVRRIATRLYVTLPGAATRGMAIDSVTPRIDSRWFPGKVTTDVLLANTGRVRLEPIVVVGGQPARGSKVLLSRSVERYTATKDLPWYGGIVQLPVQATDGSGLTRTVDKTMIVVPWGLLLAIAAAGLVGWRVRHWWQRRSTRMDGLQADLRRLERLLASQAMAAVHPTDLAALDRDSALQGAEVDAGADRVADLFVAIKRAQRAGAHESLSRLALELHSLRGSALPQLLDALGTAQGDQRAALISAIGSYDAQDVASEMQARGLAPEVLPAAPVAAAPVPAAPRSAAPRSAAPRATAPRSAAPRERRPAAASQGKAPTTARRRASSPAAPVKPSVPKPRRDAS